MRYLQWLLLGWVLLFVLASPVGAQPAPVVTPEPAGIHKGIRNGLSFTLLTTMGSGCKWTKLAMLPHPTP